jgi:Zn-finger nucleic acid-binding protein
MNCLACKTISLVPHDLETNLTSFECPACGGRWIEAFQYWNWLHQLGNNLPEHPAQETELPVADSKEAKICPECGRILSRCRVGHDLHFVVERCVGCGGIWFDRNEWENLKSRNLHDDVHFIFSAAWQAKVRKEELETKLDELLRAKVGKQDFAEIQRIREWLRAHPFGRQLYAYLKPVQE